MRSNRVAPWRSGLILIVAFGLRAAMGAGPASAPESDEIMRPTQHGLRATPELVKGIARMFVRHAPPTRDLGLSEDQQKKVADAMTRRLMESAHSHGEQWRGFIEMTVAAELLHHGRHNAETGPDFARCYLPLIPEMRRLQRTILEDCRTILDPEQARLLEGNLQDLQDILDGTQDRMQRWEKGEIKQDEYPFNSTVDKQRSPEEQIRREQTQRRLRSVQGVRRELYGLLPANWKPFLERVASMFDYTQEQRQQADQILADYAAQVEQIMTADWMAGFHRNRMRLQYVRLVGKRPPRPWSYHLQREYDQLADPIVHLRDRFRDEVFGLATDQQRLAAFERIRSAAAIHGVQDDELRDMQRLLMQPASTTPSTGGNP